MSGKTGQMQRPEKKNRQGGHAEEILDQRPTGVAKKICDLADHGDVPFGVNSVATLFSHHPHPCKELFENI
jgi:hypothetical protein